MEETTLRVVTPGKFEGEPRWAEHFWSLAMEGAADEEHFEDPQEGGDGPLVCTFFVEPADVGRFPELAGVAFVELWEGGDGFVYTSATKTVA